MATSWCYLCTPTDRFARRFDRAFQVHDLVEKRAAYCALVSLGWYVGVQTEMQH